MYNLPRVTLCYYANFQSILIYGMAHETRADSYSNIYLYILESLHLTDAQIIVQCDYCNLLIFVDCYSITTCYSVHKPDNVSSFIVNIVVSSQT